MVSKLQSEAIFVKFLLQADSKQAKAVLKVLSTKQCQAIQEIFLNIVNSNISFTPKVTSSLYRYKKIIKQISIKTGVHNKIKLIQKKAPIILNILKHCKTFIYKALEINKLND